MLKATKAFSSFSVRDLTKAKDFYGRVLGLDVKETAEGLEIEPNGTTVFLYPKPDHKAATFTVLNFIVDQIEKTVDELTGRGVRFEHYTGDLQTDEKGIFRGDGPTIAWFQDPDGNILSVVEEPESQRSR